MSSKPASHQAVFDGLLKSVCIIKYTTKTHATQFDLIHWLLLSRFYINVSSLRIEPPCTVLSHRNWNDLLFLTR